MFIDKDQKRANYNVICNLPDKDGTKRPYPLTLVQLAELGYTEISDPVPPTPPEGFTVEEAFFYNELTDAPYAEWTLKSPEQLNDIRRNKVIMQIEQLEARQGRAVREAALGDPTYLLKIETKIVALRATL